MSPSLLYESTPPPHTPPLAVIYHLGLFTDWNDRVLFLFYTLTSEIPTLSHPWRLKKVPLLGQNDSPYRVLYIRITPMPSPLLTLSSWFINKSCLLRVSSNNINFCFCGQIIARQFYKWSFESSDKFGIFLSIYLTVLKGVTNIVCNSEWPVVGWFCCPLQVSHWASNNMINIVNNPLLCLSFYFMNCSI